MPIVEKISQMQKQGLKDEEIAQRLREEGISPREIGEALDQSAVKSAIYTNESRMEPSIMESVSESSMQIPVPGKENLEQTMGLKQTPTEFPQMSQEMPEEAFPQATQFQEMPLTQPTIQETDSFSEGYTEGAPYPYPQSEYPLPLESQAPEYQYQEYQYPAQTLPVDTEMITEVAEQIINEKLQKTEKQISEILKVKIEIQGKINNMEDRIKRIDAIIDRLQLSILKEIGNYGKNISELKQEMETTQESFSKILSPLNENIKELRKITGSATQTSSPKTQTTSTKTTPKDIKENPAKNKQTKDKNSFEHYLRE